MKRYKLQVPIRFFDVDMNNHVNNAVYFTYMENSRTEILLKEFLSFKKQGNTFVVSEASCKYFIPIRLQDKVCCEMSFEYTGAVRFNIKFEFKCEESGVLFAEGFNKMVFINELTNRPKSMPQDFIEKYLEN